MITEMNSLIERDIDELSKAMATEYKVKCKAICQQHMVETIANMVNLPHQSPCSSCNATSKASTSGGVPPYKVSDGTAGQGDNKMAQTGKDVADIDITEKISSMFIDNVKHGSGLQSSNANPSPSSPRHRSYHDDIPSFDLFKEEDPEFNFMYGDDNVGNRTEKRVR
jgi:hypothetical protein